MAAAATPKDQGAKTTAPGEHEENRKPALGVTKPCRPFGTGS
jgi:hypothetical protein